MKPTLINWAMNAEDEALKELRQMEIDGVISFDDVNQLVEPSEFNNSGLPKSEYEAFNEEQGRGLLGKIGVGAAGTYGGTLALKHGVKHLTPVTQYVSRPLKIASTYIKDFYTPETQANPIAQKKLVYEHWKNADLPGIERYLKANRNAKDVFGMRWMEGNYIDKDGNLKTKMATDRNVKLFRDRLKKYGPMQGLETADEAFYKSQLLKAQDFRAQMDVSGPTWNVDGKPIPIDDAIRKQDKRIKTLNNELRYETQKTELMKQTFGEKIDKTRWKNSGLGKIVKTDLKTALMNDNMAIAGWTKTTGGKKFSFKSALTPETRVTASYLEGDHRTLMKEAKNYGKFYMKIPMGGMPEDQQAKWNPRVRKMNGYLGKAGTESGLAEEIYKLHERGYDYKKVHSHFKEYKDFLTRTAAGKGREAANAYKAKEALNQLLKNYTWENGLMKVPYSFTSQQKAIAGVNSALTLWRGKGSSKFGKTRVASEEVLAKYRGGIKGMESLSAGTGKLHHKILVSDIYDVAGAPEAMLKNVHVNIAHTDSRGGSFRDKTITSKKPTMKIVQQLMKNKDYRTLYSMLPQMSKRVAKKAAMFLLFKRF